MSINVEPLKANHEEADARMLLHAKHASLHHKTVIAQSPDPDVLVLCTFFYTALEVEQLWFITGVKDKVQHIPVYQLAPTLGTETNELLPGFYALTGCDSTSGIRGIGKRKAWKELQKTKSTNQGIRQVGDVVPLTELTVSACEKFLCSIQFQGYASSNNSR